MSFPHSIPVRLLRLALACAVLLSVAVVGTASAAAPATTHKVSATGSLTFSPKTVKVHVGDTVTWTNTSTGIPHTVTSNTNAWTSTELPSNGSTFSVTFTTKGTFQYHCQFHAAQGMRGTISVQ